MKGYQAQAVELSAGRKGSEAARDLRQKIMEVSSRMTHSQEQAGRYKEYDALIDAAVAPLVSALQKNADALRKCLTGGEVKAHEAGNALADAIEVLEKWSIRNV